MNVGPVVRQAAWAAFQRGDFAAALDAFLVLADADGLDSADLHVAVELMTDRGQIEQAGALIERTLGRWRETGSAEAELEWQVIRFDRVTDSSAARREAAMQLLETLGRERDAATWLRVLSDERRAALEASFDSAHDRLAALEQESFAPAETGLTERARALIEEIGVVHAREMGVARAAERLLHALGDPAAAYRVERARRTFRERGAGRHVEDSGVDEDALRGLSIVLVGGHQALRVLITRDLARSGVARVEVIPSATEGIRSGRDVQGMVNGVDLVVILVRQVAHSTSEQVKRAARRANVPVAIAETAGIAGVRRAIARWLAEGTAT
ncbi:MAG: DUF2325 domain-containing protein [Hyphomicrobiales bacterium]|nr:DUF2325 domain-containing protein [Hyphomicrobiales bacterium]